MLDTSKWDTSGREVWSAMNQMDSYYNSLVRQQERAAKLAEWKKDADNRALQRDIMNTQLGMAADETKATVVPRALIDANRSRIAQGDPETFAKIMSSNGGGTYVPAGADSIQQVDATGTPIGKPIIVPRGAEAMTQALSYAGAIPTGQFAGQFFPSTKAYDARDLHLQLDEEKRRDELQKLKMQMQLAAQGLGGLRGLGGLGGLGGLRIGRRGAGAGAEDSDGRIDIKTTDIERLQSFADQEAARQNGLAVQNGQILTADGMPATEAQRTKFLNDSYKLFNMWANNYVQSGGNVLGATVGTRNMSLRGGSPLTEADLQFEPLAVVGNPHVQADAAVPAGAVLDASGRPYIPMQTMPEEYGQLGIPALVRGVRGIWDAIGQPMLTK